MNTQPEIATRVYPHSGDSVIAVQSTLSDDSTDKQPHVMFFGGFHSAMSGTKATAFQELCDQRAWHYTRFDYRGHGLSGGNPEDLTISDWLADSLAVFDDCNRPTLLIGSSMGAWLATMVALRRAPRVDGLLLLAAAPDFLQELIEPQLGPAELWDLQQQNTVKIANRYEQPYPITQALLDSGKTHSLLADGVQDTLNCPLVMVHGSNDEDVPYSLSLRLMEKLGNETATLTLINGADHRLSDEASLQIIEQALIALVARTYTS
jgi:pimeloyl-ACP methyl ester carboxylesterase